MEKDLFNDARRDVYTVTALTRDLRGTLEDVFSDIWVEGEVSNYTLSSAGHAYFSLKDKNSVLNCVMFKSAASRVKFDIENGMKVLCNGRISVYDKRGQYQLYVDIIDPRGIGSLQAAFEQLKKKLEAEGLFAEERKKELPYLPRCIGVVTSPTGAAIRDILKVTRRRFPNIEIIICPVRVQGDEAKDDIAEAVGYLNEFNEQIISGESPGTPVDVMIVGRGGGSLEDLWPFNEEIVARAIYSSKIPVVSAVGHEIDFTISDFTADIRAATPSAAAEIVVPLKEDLENEIDGNIERQTMSIMNTIDMYANKIEALSSSYVLRDPLNVFMQLRQQVDDLMRAANTNIMNILEHKKKDMAFSAGKLNALSPLAVLERGYSITFADGKALRDTKDVKKGDIIKTRTAKGEISSKVEKVTGYKEK